MEGSAELLDRIARLDPTLFEHVEAQLDLGDRRSLLALHAACRAVFGSFSYLEIGSHLGGSLQVFVRDPACEAIVSIDPRPMAQPDERGIRYKYPENSTERMLAALAAIPGADLSKLHTIERRAEEIDPAELPVRPQLALVDGEHTDRAALVDALFCDAAMGGEGCIAFHDAPVIYRGIGEYLRGLEGAGRPFAAYVLPSSIFVVELGEARLLPAEPLDGLTREAYRAYFHALSESEPYRAEYRRLPHRVLRRLERAVLDAGRRLSGRTR